MKGYKLILDLVILLAKMEIPFKIITYEQTIINKR